MNNTTVLEFCRGIGSYIALGDALDVMRVHVGDSPLALDCSFLALLQLYPHFLQSSLAITPSFLKVQNLSTQNSQTHETGLEILQEFNQ
jgi:hypothetical protein